MIELIFKKKKMKKILLVVSVIGLTIIGYSFIKPNHNTPATTVTGTGTNIGDVAPELKYKNPEGKELALSSTRGQFVLIDFWASWCGPCRMENPTVVAAYNKFKDRKFTIYSVSLDKNSAAWTNAMQKDGLSWPNHVSDLMGWQSQAAAIYGVNSIPTNFLLDPEGVIRAKNLRGHELAAAIEKVMADYNESHPSKKKAKSE